MYNEGLPCKHPGQTEVTKRRTSRAGKSEDMRTDMAIPRAGFADKKSKFEPVDGVEPGVNAGAAGAQQVPVQLKRVQEDFRRDSQKN